MSNLSIILKTAGDQPRTYALRAGWNRIVRSFALHWLKCGPWEILRKTNGVAGQQGGGMFFDSLEVVADGPIKPMALRQRERVIGSNNGQYMIAEGGAHYWLPRAVMTRRISLVGGGDPSIRGRELMPTGTALGALALVWRNGSQSTRDRMVSDLLTGVADESADFVFAAMGPWHPSGIHEGYAHGGKGTAPSPGYRSRYDLTVLRSDVSRERNNIDLLDATTGEPIPDPDGVDIEKYAAEQGRWGKDWCVRLSTDPYYSPYGPKDWNVGTCPYRDGLIAFNIINGEHLVRQADEDIAGAAVWGDPACFMNARISALRAMQAWPATRLDTIMTVGILGRQFAWVSWLVAAVRELATRGGDYWNVGRLELAGYEKWLEACAKVFVRTQSPAGTWQVYMSPWANWSPSPASFTTQAQPGVVKSVPSDRGLAQSHEHGALIAAAFSVWRQLPKGSLRTQLGVQIMHAADAWMRDSAPAPLHWLVGKKAGALTPDMSETWGEGDSVYMWYAATFASRVACAQQPGMVRAFVNRALEAIRLRTPDPAVDRYLRAMLRKSGKSTPAAFVTEFSKPNQTYTDFNVDAATDMQEAIDRGWTP